MRVCILATGLYLTDPLHFGFDFDYRATEDFLLFREKAKDTRDNMLLGRYPPRISQMAVYWDDFLNTPYVVVLHSDFFPVVITFLRQLPFIGTFLSLPYIREFIDRLAGSRQSAV
ncbi:hypothetical protein D9756_007433 [Leucocoprinus leucothites]|uniref:Uncharacterized protein n=1 Tax=Leucocoprinus leucothites TaxID=201217 RepID=A0A8H5D195_9AGAR|nr:hypothetical protein D9756_007433 [Leucoagaricus leucothites]